MTEYPDHVQTDLSAQLHQLEAREVFQTRDYRSPYLLSGGFNTRWWSTGFYRAETQEDQYLGFYLGESEVARAKVQIQPIGNLYENFEPPSLVTEIFFLEVHQAFRGQGVGRAIVQLLVDRYPGELLVAFSEGTDEFWRALSWRYHPRLDGDQRHRSFFILDMTVDSGWKVESLK